MIIKRESWNSEFARLCFATYLFMLRLPSEALLLTRALPDERLLSTDKASPPAVIGLRDFGREPRLILKLAKRKNSRSHFTAMRPCFCGDNALLPRHNCPIRRFWKYVIAHTRPGYPLSPSLLNKNITRISRKVLRELGIEDHDRYSTHCFRHGAATAILNSGSTLSEIMRTGGWASSSFKVYLDLHRSEESAMKRALTVDSPGSTSPVSASSLSGDSTSSITSSAISKDKTD